MARFLTCVERMVASKQEREEISKEMERYEMARGTFGFTMAIKNRTTKMSCKLQFVSTFKFHNSFSS